MMQSSTLAHYINDITLIKPDKQEMASMLEDLKRHPAFQKVGDRHFLKI